jgi:hypothetical protein
MMLSITDGAALARALDMPLDARLAALLLLRQEQLGGEIAPHAHFIVIQPGDRPRWLEDALGFSILRNPGDGTRWGDPDYSPGFEFIEDHGFCFELTFELTTDFTHAVFVENAPGVNPKLLEFCRTYSSEHA